MTQQVNIPTGLIHYVDEGEGPAIVFGHSYLWTAEMWRPQVDALKDRYRCIVPELWSHGASGILEADVDCYPIDELSFDMKSFVDALGLEQFSLVGLSIGGMWGGRLALELPERVQALVLADTDLGEESPQKRATFEGMINAVDQAGSLVQPIREAVKPFFFSDTTLATQPSLVNSFIESLAGIPASHIPGVCAVGRGFLSRPSVLGRLKNIKCPTLVVVGEQDRSRPLSEAEPMARLIPGARLEIIPAAGHIANLEQPKTFTRLLDTFLADALS